jgi:hypothetical protein
VLLKDGTVLGIEMNNRSANGREAWAQFEAAASRWAGKKVKIKDWEMLETKEEWNEIPIHYTAVDLPPL